MRLHPHKRFRVAKWVSRRNKRGMGVNHEYPLFCLPPGIHNRTFLFSYNVHLYQCQASSLNGFPYRGPIPLMRKSVSCCFLQRIYFCFICLRPDSCGAVLELVNLYVFLLFAKRPTKIWIAGYPFEH